MNSNDAESGSSQAKWIIIGVVGIIWVISGVFFFKNRKFARNNAERGYYKNWSTPNTRRPAWYFGKRVDQP